MRATTFEFRNRFWMIGLIIGASFWLYAVDHVNAADALAGWISAHSGWSRDLVVRVMFALGAVFALIAAWIRTWATSFLRTEVVHDAAVHSERLVADGPYRHVRNPLYVGTILLTFGLALMASRVGALVMIAGIVVFNLRLIGREEAELSASQGESYRQYLKTVPCLIPSLSSRVAPGGGTPQWKQAFLGEGFFWAFAAGVVAFAITLKLVYFWITMAVGFLFYLVSLAVLKKQETASGD